jgi:3-hydroxyisobutyrate dehydrogenase-like beta-hydroxyacid dehydrogenase
MNLPGIGFVGVGRMGANMARRLKEVGYSIVAVYPAMAKKVVGSKRNLVPILLSAAGRDPVVRSTFRAVPI